MGSHPTYRTQGVTTCRDHGCIHGFRPGTLLIIKEAEKAVPMIAFDQEFSVMKLSVLAALKDYSGSFAHYQVAVENLAQDDVGSASLAVLVSSKLSKDPTTLSNVDERL